MSYTVGDLVRLTAAFTSTDDGSPIDPTVVLFKVLKHDGSELTPTPVHDSTGVYHVDVSIDLAGIWHWRASGSGAAQAAKEAILEVEKSAF